MKQEAEDAAKNEYEEKMREAKEETDKQMSEQKMEIAKELAHESRNSLMCEQKLLFADAEIQK